jgi:hypothetical protein
MGRHEKGRIVHFDRASAALIQAILRFKLHGSR